jgi:uncharacterized protein YkwD
VLTFARRLLAGSIVILVLACAGPTAPSSYAAAPVVTAAAGPTPPAETTASVLSLTNVERRRAGLEELRESGQLRQAAQLQTDQMGSLSVMDHVLPGAPYPSPADRLAAVHYAWSAYGENVAMGQRSANEVVTAWMNSPGHRANILNPRYTELGVGYALDQNGRPYYAQVFGRPAN